MERQILIVLGSRTCVPEDPLLAAKELGCYATVLTPRPPTCGTPTELMDRVERVQLNRPHEAITLARRLHSEVPVAAVMGYEEDSTALAAQIASSLGLPSHPVDAAEAAMDKPTMKERFVAADVPTADHILARDEDDAVRWAGTVGYPVVVKPCRGGASQGVIRADDEDELRHAYRRLCRLARDYGLDNGGRSNSTQLVERYLDGEEISVELLFQDGEAEITAVFEKPRPLVGPFFEETVYMTPPQRLDEGLRREAEALAVRGAAALGLHHGPAHCEIRLTKQGPMILEIAARLLGGVCARVFQDRLDENMHSLLMRVAMDELIEMPSSAPENPVTAAMMLPIPGEGRVVTVNGTDRAERVPGIRTVTIVACPGDVIVPFPESMCYSVGFLSAAGSSHEAVSDALAWASSSISLELAPIDCDRWVRSLNGDDASYRPSEEFTVSTLGDIGHEEARQTGLSMLTRIMFDELPRDEAFARARQTLEWEEGNRGDPAWVFIQGQSGKAMSLGFVKDETGYLCCAGVLPEYRRAGIGEALFRAQLAEFARRGCTTVISETDPRLPLAPAALQRVGFEQDASSCCPPAGTTITRSCDLEAAGRDMQIGGAERSVDDGCCMC